MDYRLKFCGLSIYSIYLLSKLHILFSVTVNLETIISKLGRLLFHNNSYIMSTLFFAKSSAVLKIVKMLLFGRDNAVFNIESQFNINKT